MWEKVDEFTKQRDATWKIVDSSHECMTQPRYYPHSHVLVITKDGASALGYTLGDAVMELMEREVEEGLNLK